MPPQWIAARPRTGRLNSVVLHPRPKLPSAFQHMHDKQPAHSHICQSSRSEEHTSELQSLMRISYAVFCLKNKKNNHITREQLPTPDTCSITDIISEELTIN